MCFCPGKRLKCMGLTLSIIFFFAAVICIILAGVNFNFTNFNFASAQYSWKNLGALQVASIIYTLFTSLLGIFTFWCANICLIIIVSFIKIINIIFILNLLNHFIINILFYNLHNSKNLTILF